jgi:hypothetical protein
MIVWTYSFNFLGCLFCSLNSVAENWQLTFIIDIWEWGCCFQVLSYLLYELFLFLLFDEV